MYVKVVELKMTTGVLMQILNEIKTSVVYTIRGKEKLLVKFAFCINPFS